MAMPGTGNLIRFPHKLGVKIFLHHSVSVVNNLTTVPSNGTSDLDFEKGVIKRNKTMKTRTPIMNAKNQRRSLAS